MRVYGVNLRTPKISSRLDHLCWSCKNAHIHVLVHIDSFKSMPRDRRSGGSLPSRPILHVRVFGQTTQAPKRRGRRQMTRVVYTWHMHATTLTDAHARPCAHVRMRGTCAHGRDTHTFERLGILRSSAGKSGPTEFSSKSTRCAHVCSVFACVNVVCLHA
jgi:hypothetical protein